MNAGAGSYPTTFSWDDRSCHPCPINQRSPPTQLYLQETLTFRVNTTGAGVVLNSN